MKFQIFEDVAGEWRWRLITKQGKVLADCGEGYKTKGGCVRALDKFPSAVEDATETAVEYVPKAAPKRHK